MVNMRGIQARINRLYRTPKKNIYQYRFFDDLSSGYSFVFGEKSESRNFFSFEPRDCSLAKLMEENDYYNLSRDIESVVERLIYSLIMFGRAYMCVIPQYSVSIDSNRKEFRSLSSIQINEIQGLIKKRNRSKIEFYCRTFNGIPSKKILQSNQLIEFNLRELGYSKKYFVKMLKRLGRCDITSFSTFMMRNKSKTYDFSVHSKKNKLLALKATKSIGWLADTEELSDSYLLYKKIQGDKLKLSLLNYILKKMNYGLGKFIDNFDGKIVAQVNEKNYDQLWKDYSEGRMTGTELANILYP